MEMLFPVPSMKLVQPLGEWIDIDDASWLDDWDWFISDNDEFIFHHLQDGSWHRHLRLNNSHSKYHCQYLTFQDSPDDNLNRISVVMKDTYIQKEGLSPEDILENPTTEFFTLGPISVTQPSCPWMLRDIEHSQSVDELWGDILTGEAILVSDGSFFPEEKVGAAAWILSSSTGTQWIAGGGRISGPAEVQSAYHSELGGNTAGIDFLSHLSLPTHQPTMPIVTALDGKGALNMCGKEKEWVRLSSNHFNLIAINSSLWNKSSFTIQKQHVLGHQDVLGRPLTLLEIPTVHVILKRRK